MTCDIDSSSISLQCHFPRTIARANGANELTSLRKTLRLAYIVLYVFATRVCAVRRSCKCASKCQKFESNRTTRCTVIKACFSRRKQFQQRFGITVAFMATHSGLTRWQNYHSDEDEDTPLPGDQFGKQHPRAIDEVWYRRAVDQHYVSPDSVVYSVPLDEIADNTTLVTASYAIVIGESTFKMQNYLSKAREKKNFIQFQHVRIDK